jgi:hypothetical protein
MPIDLIFQIGISSLWVQKRLLMEKKMVELALDTIIASIYEIRGQKVMLDKDLAFLYGVTTGNLNKAVNRNLQRFPPDFMFELSNEEWEQLKPMVEEVEWGGTRKPPKVFTEQGVAMLSGVLSSERAILVNIQIMRAYSRIRSMLFTHKDLLLKLEELEKRVAGQDANVSLIFEYLKQFIELRSQPRKQIGFRANATEADVFEG